MLTRVLVFPSCRRGAVIRQAILVVEDNALTRKMVRITLEQRGFRVLEAPDGQTALTVFTNEHPALVLQDLHLPDIDGSDLIARLRLLPQGDGVPIIAFSGLMSKIEEARAARAGFTDYLFKPVQPERLLEVVEAYLAPRRQLAERPGAGRRILLVDDDPIQLRLALTQLEDFGFTVEGVTEAEQAVVAAEAVRPDVIVADLLMGGISGVELCLQVRRHPVLADIPVVIISPTFAHIDADDRRLAEQIGASAFVERGPGLTDVMREVLAVLDRGPPARPTADADALHQAYVARLVKQLDHQSALNTRLARRAGMDAALLSIMTGAAQILTRDIDLPLLLQEVLSRALDAGGVSAGAIFLLDDGEPAMRAHAGLPHDGVDKVRQFFGQLDLLRDLCAADQPVRIPSPAVPDSTAAMLLAEAGCAAMAVAPMLASGASHGALVMLSNSRELGEGWLASIGAVASQLGQAVALSSSMTQLRLSEERYRSLFEGLPTGVFRSTRAGKILDANQELVHLLGAPSRQALLDVSATSFYADPEERELWQRRLRRDGEVRDVQLQMQRLDGTPVWVSLTARAIRGPDSQVLNYEGALTDISARKEAETLLRATEDRLRLALASSDAVIYLLRIDREGQVPEWTSENLPRVTGHALDAAADPAWWRSHIHPEDRARIEAQDAEPISWTERTREYRFRKADGGYLWLRDAQRVVPGADGRPAKIAGAWIDVTERKGLETQLIQAQKMEAIGQLAAGVAHDFNNMLTAISGYAELLHDDLVGDDARRGSVDEIRQAAARAATLTRQLLAFGRRQLLQPVVLDLNEVLRATEKMLGRIIGEDIELHTVLGTDLSPVKLDPGQMEQVVLNLAVNARDAMEAGGRLTIETANACYTSADAEARGLSRAGPYVVLSVTDTGIGMAAEVQAHIFEPFFTTKEQGKGTGLGLSTVYGIVRQSNGNILVYSEPGVGTTFKLYFPASGDGVSAAAIVAEEKPLPRDAAILLVEDEDAVRRFAGEVLRRHGYRVTAAANAQEALEIAARNEPVDLLLTDVIMPGMGGRALSDQLRHSRPGLKVVFMSGYAGEAIVRHGILAPGIAFVDKPFTAAGLLEKVGQALDAA